MSEKRFTLEPVDWKPWLDLVDVETATKDELAAIDAAPGGSRTSPYVLTLLHDLASLNERSPLFNSIMFAPQGLPRAERELATVITSMVNGCTYCASVHSRRFAELTKKPEVMEVLFQDGAAALEPRLRAVSDFVEKLSRNPQEMTAADLAPLRKAGLDDLQILDLIHATAMFANANRLMLTLGEAVPPLEESATADVTRTE
jgi:uncharacterized peroxidase-related enzyme